MYFFTVKEFVYRFLNRSSRESFETQYYMSTVLKELSKTEVGRHHILPMKTIADMLDDTKFPL